MSIRRSYATFDQASFSATVFSTHGMFKLSTHWLFKYSRASCRGPPRSGSICTSQATRLQGRPPLPKLPDASSVTFAHLLTAEGAERDTTGGSAFRGGSKISPSWIFVLYFFSTQSMMAHSGMIVLALARGMFTASPTDTLEPTLRRTTSVYASFHRQFFPCVSSPETSWISSEHLKAPCLLARLVGLLNLRKKLRPSSANRDSMTRGSKSSSP